SERHSAGWYKAHILRLPEGSMCRNPSRPTVHNSSSPRPPPEQAAISSCLFHSSPRMGSVFSFCPAQSIVLVKYGSLPLLSLPDCARLPRSSFYAFLFRLPDL